MKEAPGKGTQGDLGKIRRIYGIPGWLWRTCRKAIHGSSQRSRNSRVAEAVYGGISDDDELANIYRAEWNYAGEFSCRSSDDGAALIRWRGRCEGCLTASQIAVGVEKCRNELKKWERKVG